MDIKAKKFIAREGLILILVLGLGLTFLLGGQKYELYYGNKALVLAEINNEIKKDMTEDAFQDLSFRNKLQFLSDTALFHLKKRLILAEVFSRIKLAGWIFLVYIYPAYILLKFILWAIKTLNE